MGSTGEGSVRPWTLLPEVRAGSTPTSYGYLLTLIRSRPGWTRQQLLAATGLSRTTLVDRLDALFTEGLVYADGSVPRNGEAGVRGPGRRSELLRFDDRDKIILVFDLGQTQGRVCVTDVHGQILRMAELRQGIDADPEDYLRGAFAMAHGLLDASRDLQLVGVGLSIPGPVDPDTGILGHSTTMPQWQSFPISDTMQAEWRAPVLIENDARAFALGEASVAGSGETVLAIKYATGIGAGIVVDGRVIKGSDGAAGDIGHIRLTDDGPLCTCGRQGCLAAWASGHALVEALADTGVRTTTEVAGRVEVGDEGACAALDRAVSRLGRVLATVVATVNPDTLVLGGQLGRLPRVVAAIDDQIHADVVARATQRLTVQAARLGPDGATVGLARKVAQLVFSPQAVDAWVERVRADVDG